MSAPASKNQPSRKGKRAWRKNIDIADISSGIEAARNESVITGGKGLLADAPADLLFQTDVSGDLGIKQKVLRDHGNLKVDEILAQRSAVPALTTRKRLSDDSASLSKKRKTAQVSRKEIERLRQVAFGGPSNAVAQTSLDNEIYDPWDVPPPPEPKPEQSYIEAPKPIREPGTLRHAPISLTVSGKAVPNVRRPSAAKSYQPVATDWLDALEAEGAKAVAKEKARLLAAEKEAERLARIHASAEEAEKDRENDMLSEYESEWDGFQSDMDDATLKKKRPQRKTPAERNKINRRKAAERLARHESRMKQRDEQAKKIEAIRKEVEAKEYAKSSLKHFKVQNPGSVVSEDEDSEEEQLRKRRFGQRPIPEGPLELVLPDELEESLRRLKPEGNLLNERFRNLIVQGKIEARPRPLGQQKQRKVKVTEKWSYKDWKLQ